MSNYYDDVHDLRMCWLHTKEWDISRRYSWLLSVAETLGIK